MRGATAIFLCVAAVETAAADYEACARWFGNDAPASYRTRDSGPFFATRLCYVPFRLTKNGRIDTSGHDVVSHTGSPGTDGMAWEEVVTYRAVHPDLLESLDVADVTAETPKDAVATVSIRRNAAGDIAEIVEKPGLTEDEIDDRKQGQEEDALYFAHIGTSTRFRISDGGQCVPVDRREIVLRESPDGGHAEEIANLVFDVAYCRDIAQSIYGTRGAVAAFDREVNRPALEVLRKWKDTIGFPEEKVLLSNEKVDEMINSRFRRTAPIHDLRLQLLTGYMAWTQLSSFERKKLGISPLITTYMTLIQCYEHELSDFFMDDSLWPDVETPDESNSGNTLGGGGDDSQSP